MPHWGVIVAEGVGICIREMQGTTGERLQIMVLRSSGLNYFEIIFKMLISGSSHYLMEPTPFDYLGMGSEDL